MLALCSIGASARAQEDWVEKEPRWIPSLRLGFDTFEYTTESTVTNFINQPKNAGIQNNSNSLFMLQLGGELMGPVLSERLPGRPRLFAQGGVQFMPFSSDSVFEIDVPDAQGAQDEVGKFQSTLAQSLARPRPCDQDDPSTCPLKPQTFLGEGSTIDADFQNFSWSGALGVAFTFPVANSLLLEVKPFVSYNIDRIDISGEFVTALETGNLVPRTVVRQGRPPVTVFVPEFLVYSSEGSKKITQHSLGPGLELDAVLFRSARPLRTSLYADARFLWLLSDRTTTFSDSVASYEVKRDPFEIRGGAGVRFSWMGFGGR